ncbi:EcsC family protein [soil metagenome]
MGLFTATEPNPDDEVGESSFAARISMSALHWMVDLGVDGAGPLDSAQEVADAALAQSPDEKAAVAAIVKRHLRLAAGGGFATGVGGLVTMPVALPANIVSFYAVAARMVAAVAAVRGYDVNTESTRTAIVLTLLRVDADDLLRKAGMVSGGKMSAIALNRVPKAAAMVINKGVGFRVAGRLGSRAAGRLGRAVPLAGGVIGAGLDTYLMKRLADDTREQFTPLEQAAG